ncbi:hypothetical protein F2Q69_00014162 [Brassica cretica]|uniref:Uncharacterized protein n=1 Tax=Brassica cretica TaxID=69181 RepID=A0A8S9R0G7_BRACR|nr:hypothetical protein F2Q69_00014162 [Brassica cretica]
MTKELQIPLDCLLFASVSRSCGVPLKLKDTRFFHPVPLRYLWGGISLPQLPLTSKAYKFQSLLTSLRMTKELQIPLDCLLFASVSRSCGVPLVFSFLGFWLSLASFFSPPSVFPYERHTPDAVFSFINNFKLSQQARGEIIIGLLLRGSALLPGREVTAEFHHHRARGSSLTVPHSAFSTSKVCLVISPNPKKNREYMTSQLLCCRIFGKDDLYVPK